MVYLPQISTQTRYFSITLPLQGEIPADEELDGLLKLQHYATGKTYTWDCTFSITDSDNIGCLVDRGANYNTELPFTGQYLYELKVGRTLFSSGLAYEEDWQLPNPKKYQHTVEKTQYEN